MTRLRVAPALRHSQDRLYVTLPDGTGVAWYDRSAGRVSLLPGAGREEVLAALAPYLSGEVTVGPPPVPTPAELDRLALHPDDDLAPNRPGRSCTPRWTGCLRRGGLRRGGRRCGGIRATGSCWRGGSWGISWTGSTGRRGRVRGSGCSTPYRCRGWIRPSGSTIC